MKPKPLHSVIDSFVTGVGGELISELLDKDKKDQPPNADYLFRDHNVIAELKALEVDSFGPSFCNKMGKLMGDWQREGRLIVTGRTKVESRQLSSECQKDLANLLASPLQLRVVGTADKQIGSTKKTLKMPTAKGLLWVASDGNIDLQPDVVWFLLKRILQKKKQSGDPQYSNLQALAYFSPRMPVETPLSNKPTLFWLSGSRQTDDHEMQAFLKMLCDAWWRYAGVEEKIAVSDGSALPDENFRFWGTKRRMPTIQVRFDQPPRNPVE